MDRKESSAVLFEEIGFIIFEEKFDCEVSLSAGKTMQLFYKNRPIDVKIESDTLLPQNVFLPGEKMCVIAKIDSDCRAKAVVPKKFYDMFDAINDLEKKLTAMAMFIRLPLHEQNSFLAQLSGEKFPASSSAFVPIHKPETLRLKFEMCRNTYTPQQQLDIESILAESESTSLGFSHKEKAKRRLQYILNINQGSGSEITLTKEEIISKLDECLYGHKKVKEQISEAIVASKFSEKKGMALLLIGSPGSGKTALSKALAKVLNLPFFILPLGSQTSLLDLTGDAPQFDASNSGEVVQIFYRAGTTRIVMCLDEFDKSFTCAKEGRACRAFNDALSDEHFFKDVFLGTYINTSNTIFIATANSTENIPPNLLNRFTVIHIDDYSEEDKVQIGKRFIFPSILKEKNIGKSEITITDSAIRHIVTNFCDDIGARRLKQHLESLVSKILSSWDSSQVREHVTITKSFVDRALECTINPRSPIIIIYRRNKELYSDDTAAEIKDLILKLQREDINGDLLEKYKLKLNYLVNLIPVGDAFSDFNKERFFCDLNKTHYGMEQVKNEIAQAFNAYAINNKPFASLRILLVGPPGVGKSSIAESIAKACNSKFCRISLNGVSDEASIKGHSLTYTGADAGRIVRALYKAKTTRCTIVLDEIDKLCTQVANTLVDLLDDSSQFTDNFLGQALDLSGALFIATANDISTIDPVLLDRFRIIHIDGYTQYEKKKIVSDYLIPETIAELVPENYSLTFSDDALRAVTGRYCRSFGVRDVKQGIKKIVEYKLYNAIGNDLVIRPADVVSALGEATSERGNFPFETYPGLSKALAVTGNCGMAFSVETVLIPDENTLITTGLPQESTVDSVKLAISYIKANYPGLLSNKGIHIHFGEGAVKKDGPSAGVAILMSLLTAAFNTSIADNIAYTGEINANGYVFKIGGTKAKIQAAEQSGCTKVFIPYDNYTELDKEALEQFSIDIVPVRHINEVITQVLPSIEKLGKRR